MTHEEQRLRRLEAAKRIRAGETISAVATSLGVGVSVVKSACQEHNVRPPFSARQEGRGRVMDILARLFDANESMAAIGRKLGISTQRVHQVYHLALAAGIPGLPQRKEPS